MPDLEPSNTDAAAVGATAPVANSYPMPGHHVVWLDRLRPGVDDSDSVRLVQDALQRLGYAVNGTGAYDAATIAAVKAFQTSLGDDERDGLLGPLQTARLFRDAGLVVEIRTEPSDGVPQRRDEPQESPSTPRTFNVVFTNALRRTDPDRLRKRWPERVDHLVKHVKQGKPSVVLGVELDQVSSRDLGRRLGDQWTWHRYAGVAVFWEKTVWQGNGDAANQFVYPDNQNRRLLSLPLVHRATGRKVFFDVTHLENDGDPATDGHRARLIETKAMAARAKAGDRVLGWDCNSTTLATENKTSRQREKPRVIAASMAGFRFVTNLPAVLNRKLASHHGGKRATPNGDWIDDIGIRGNLAFESAELIRTDQTDASDHHVLRATVRL